MSKPPASIDLEADAVPQVGDNALKAITSAAQRKVDLEAEIAALEAALADRKRDLGALVRAELPDMLLENSIAELVVYVVKDGLRTEAKVGVKDFINASIPSETAIEAADGHARDALLRQRDGALAYLRGHKLGDVIKQAITFGLARGEDKKAKALIAAAKKLKIGDVKQRVSVHPGTLAKLARDLRAQGKPLPDALFNVSEGREAFVSIKRK